MQRRPQGSAYRSAQGTHRSAGYSERGYSRTQPAPQRKNASYAGKSASPLKKILLGKNRAGQTPVWRMIVTDALIFGIALVVFAFFHHGMPREEEAVGITSGRNAVQQEQVAVSATSAPTPVPTAVPEASAAPVAAAVSAASVPTPTAAPAATAAPAPTAAVDPIGYFGNKFADKFTDGEVIRDGTSYRSANVNVTASMLREYDSNVYFVDLYVRDISCFRSEFAKGKFGRGISEWPINAAKRLGSVVTLSGDYYGGRGDGVVIRNGVLYRDKDTDRDVGVIYWDGTMKCFSPHQFTASIEMEKGAYQAWNFGPMLLDENGKAMTEFNSSVSPKNPRAAIGYFEPGHYCLVAVDGRTKKSRGMSLQEMSEFFERMGCKAAYNLDGGATAAMVCGNELVSDPSGDGRACSDFVVVVDEIIAGF